MTDEGTPIAYTGLPPGVPVVSSSGRVFGTVEQVLQIPEQDLFDGIVVATQDGSRFVERDQVDEITTARVSCLLTDEQVVALPEPSGGAPVYKADVSGTATRGRWGSRLRRTRWKRTN